MKAEVLCICGHPAKKHDRANVARPSSILAGCGFDPCRCTASREDFTHANRLSFGRDAVWFVRGFLGRPKAVVMVRPRGMTLRDEVALVKQARNITGAP